jgi:effector-binding domain-containing protein
VRLSIGEFSLVTQLSIKSLRLYHEKELLIPADVDPQTGYRYYDDINYETARSIRILKEFDFSLAEIGELLQDCADDGELLQQLEAKLAGIARKVERYDAISSSIRSILESERESAMESHGKFEIEETDLETILIAAHRMRGAYATIGQGLGLVCRKAGRHVNGKPMGLFHDDEYKEDDADFEACVPVRKGDSKDGVVVRELPGGRCVTLVHAGSYETLRESYRRLFAYVSDQGYQIMRPTREVYRKGPGMILKGNPKNYLTEIQVLVRARTNADDPAQGSADNRSQSSAT